MLADSRACARQVSNEVGFVKKARSAWREELGLLESRLADMARTAEQQAADKETKLVALNTALDGFKSEARAAFEGVKFSHNRRRRRRRRRRLRFWYAGRQRRGWRWECEQLGQVVGDPRRVVRSACHRQRGRRCGLGYRGGLGYRSDSLAPL